jgi:uncharacterized membrane protein (Fun14 family)
MDETPEKKRRLANAVKELPSWKKKLLTFSLAVAVVGGGVKASSMILARQQPAPAAVSSKAGGSGQQGSDLPGVSSNFVGKTPARGSNTAESPEPQAAEPTFTEKSSGWIFRLALSIFVGLIVGIFFRMFIKTMAVVAVLAVAGFAALSYFKVLHIDVTTLKDNYDSVAGWAQGQAGKIKDVVMAALPSTTSAFVGFFFGFKK